MALVFAALRQTRAGVRPCLEAPYEVASEYTSTTADDVCFSFETGGNPPTQLPELAFDLQLLEVPAPPIMSLMGMALLVSSRRRRIRS